MRVLLLGALGATGRRTAGELVRNPELEKLVVAGRDPVHLQRFARALDSSNERVTPAVVDVHDQDEARNAFERVDAVVSCAGPHYLTEYPAAKASILAGVSYVSLCDEYPAAQRAQSLSEIAQERGVTVVNGCGLSPGITNFMIDLAAGHLEQVEEINIALARSATESEGRATALHFLYELTRDAPFVSDHEPSTEPAATSPKLVFFPEPVGWVETFRCGHPEVVTLPHTYPDLTSLQFRIGLTEKATMDVARAFVATPLAHSETARNLFVNFSRPLRPLVNNLPPRGPSWSAARVDVRGNSKGRSSTITYGVVDHLANFVSVPLARAAVELGSGRVSHPGVHPPEKVFETKPFLRHLLERGIRVAELEPRTV
ncbi:MAG: saccharopine dehydrogenase NADP-binding domain-containing protein [Actinomycetota bacterium]|nr:saccharopine dehydrogenase NADP-binding domain-containing protein [Actinomycetota bacterium]